MSRIQAPPLAGPLGELQRRGHGGAAVRLVLEWGGTRRYIPATAAGSKLESVIGAAAAAALVEIVDKTCGGVPAEIGIPSRSSLEPTIKGEILRHPDQTPRALAMALGITERYVVKVRQDCGASGTRKAATPRPDNGQGSLF